VTEFETTDIKGVVCRFQYSFENGYDDSEIIFKIYAIPFNEMRWFSYKVKVIHQGLVKNENWSHNNNLEFSKKGIPEKIIQIASSELNCDVMSSPRTFRHGNFCSPPSQKAWERLVAQNENAILDIENDCFIYKNKLK